MGKMWDGSAQFDSCFPLAELSPDTFDAEGDQSKQAPDKWLKWLEKTLGNKGWSTRHEPLDFKMSTPANRHPIESNVNGRLVHSQWQRLVCMHFFAVCLRARGGEEKTLLSEICQTKSQAGSKPLLFQVAQVLFFLSAEPPRFCCFYSGCTFIFRASPLNTKANVLLW